MHINPQNNNSNNKQTKNQNKTNKQNQQQNQQQKTEAGFYWKVWENKWVFNCDLNEEYVCVWRMEKGRLFQVTGP